MNQPIAEEINSLVSPFQKVKCNDCGWCCQRAPCALGLFMGASQRGQCSFLEWDETLSRSQCQIIKNETSPVRKAAAEQLIFSGMGCTHAFGPHPISLIKSLMAKGYRPSLEEWKKIQENTIQEMQIFQKNSLDPDSVGLAIQEFVQFCEKFIFA